MIKKRMFTFRRPIFCTAVLIRSVLWWSLSIGIGGAAVAQSKVSGSDQAATPAASAPISDTLRIDVERSIADQLLPFDSLVQIGVRNSPSLKVDDATVESRLEQYRFTRTVVLQYVYPFVNYTTGNQTLLAAGTLNNFDQYQLTNGYRAGLHIQIPVAELFGRKHRMRGALADYQASVATRDVTRQQFRRELIRLYQGMLTAQQILKIRIRDASATLAAFQQAEMAFEDRKIDPSDYARASNLYASAQAGVAEQRGNFTQLLLELETMIGIPLSDLKR